MKPTNINGWKGVLHRFGVLDLMSTCVSFLVHFLFFAALLTVFREDVEKRGISTRATLWVFMTGMTLIRMGMIFSAQKLISACKKGANDNIILRNYMVWDRLNFVLISIYLVTLFVVPFCIHRWWIYALNFIPLVYNFCVVLASRSDLDEFKEEINILKTGRPNETAGKEIVHL